LTPGYAHAAFDLPDGRLTVVASGHGDGAVHVHQDFRLLAGNWRTPAEARLTVAGRQVWVQMIDGELDVNGELLSAGDGLGIKDAETLHLRTPQTAHFLVFDLRQTA
jgi:redox-sensitive bicupin YhaK (pirin superfamily)